MTEPSLAEHIAPAAAATAPTTPTGPTRLWESFARHAARRPEATALVWRGVPTTYGRLHDLACRAQARLAERGDRDGGARNELVAVPATKTPATVAIVLACLRSGRPVVLPSATLPDETLRLLVTDAGCRHLVTAAELLPDDEDGGPTGGPAGPADVRAAGPATPAAPGDVAFVLTTSGSTRLPKVVPLTAGAVQRFADWAAGRVGLGPGVPVLNYAPLNFDLCFLDVWATLHHGGRVVLVDPDTATRAEHLLQVLRDEGVQVVQAVPMLFQLLVDAAGTVPAPLRTVRHVLFTGDHMPPRCLSRLPALFPAARLHHVYGCTETNDSFVHEVDPAALPESAVPLGRPLPGAEAVVLDDDGAVVDGPGRGELLVATPFQTAGYLGGRHDGEDPNAGRFTTLPGGGDDETGTRFYRTGDIVRREADGHLYLEGRTDFQVKVRGTRVNTAEVERTLLEHPDVVEAGVVAVADPLAGHLLHAVLRRAPGAALNSLVLRTHCARHLPLAAIPSTLRVVDDPLPTTTTGKVDRRRLRLSLSPAPPTSSPRKDQAR